MHLKPADFERISFLFFCLNSKTIKFEDFNDNIRMDSSPRLGRADFEYSNFLKILMNAKLANLASVTYFIEVKKCILVYFYWNPVYSFDVKMKRCLTLQ